MSQNQLKIEADSLNLELGGDEEYISEAYDALRSVVMDRIEAILVRAEGLDELGVVGDQEKPQKVKRESKFKADRTNPLFRLDAVSQQIAAGKELAKIQLQFVVCTELYYRIAALTREGFRASIFGKAVDPEAINGVYIDEKAADRLRDRIEFGKTLWRELTPEGRAIVHGDKS